MAEAPNAQIAPHLYCGPVVDAAYIQLATTCPNFLILEGIQDCSGINARILCVSVQFEAGWVIPPTTPGIGVEVDEAVANPYSGDAPHLEMADRPVDEIGRGATVE